MSGSTVSGATTGPPARGPDRTAQGGAADPADGGRRRGLTPITLVIAAATLLGLALRLYQLTRPGFLLSVTEYDDGPYFGSAVRLVNGAIPYRDFLIVQPPGITLLMLPAALLSKVTGTAWAMGVGRILTAMAGAASVLLVGLLVRHRGLLAVVVACGITAVYPDANFAAHTVLVEPWLVLFCLLGALAVFDGDRLTDSRRRLIWGGAAFGFAGAIEVWAIFAVLVLACLLVLRSRRGALRFGIGLLAGFGIPVLPFLLMSPRGLYNGVVEAQVVGRVGSTRVPLAATSGVSRLKEMTGLTDLHVSSGVQLLVEFGIIVVIVGALVAAAALTRRPPPDLDWFAVGGFALISAAFLWPPQFHYHFAAFLAPFLAMAIALPLAGLAAAAAPAAGGHAAGAAASSADGLGLAAAGLAGVIILSMAIVQVGAETHQHPKLPYATVVAAQRLIPPGACLVTDEVSFSIAVNRLTSTVPGCPLLLDSTGTDFAMSHGRNPATGAARFPKLVALWHSMFARAQYVWFSRNERIRIPWTPALLAFFHGSFTRILGTPSNGALYRRNGLPG